MDDVIFLTPCKLYKIPSHFKEKTDYLTSLEVIQSN